MTADILTALIVNAVVFSVLFGLMLLVRRLFGKRMSPGLQLVLWAFVVLKLVIPFGFESDLGLFAAPETMAAASADISESANVDVSQSYSQPSYDTVQPSGSEDGAVASGPSQAASSVTGVAEITIKAESVDWMLAVFCVWMAGALTVAVVLGVGAVNIRRRVSHAKTQTPEYVREVFEECRALLGIKRRVGLTVQSAFAMPVMMGVFKPVLVLPEGALDKEALRHIMLHELSHYKRGDLLVIWGLNLLNAVYWFNPLTWLCFKRIRDDIETACDHSVFSAIGNAKRLDYIDTILHFAGETKNQRLVAAMAMCHHRATMEKRISGMFKPAKTTIGGRCAAMFVAVLMLCVSVLTACQPTPEEMVVVNKADGALEEKIAETAEPLAEYDAPDTVQDTLTKKNVTFTIDAEVSVPDVTAYPVYEVQPVAFTQEQVDTIGTVLFGKNDLFSLPEGEKINMTKDQIMDQILQMQEQLEEVKQMGDSEFNDVFDGESREEAYAEYQQHIEEYQEQYETAPDEWGEDTISATLTLNQNEYGESLKVFAESENGSISSFSVDNSYYDELGATISQIEYRENKDYVALVHNIVEGTPDNISVSKEDATQEARQLIDEMGITDMSVANVGVSLLYLLDNTSNRDTKQCWGIQFERVLDGIAVSGITGSHASDTATPQDENAVYIPTYDPEQLWVYIGDEGVLSFGWSYIAEVTSKSSNNVELMSFDQIWERAKDNFFYKLYAEEDITVKISIDNVRLSLMRIGKKDDTGTFLVVPVWDFIGSMRRTLPEGAEWPDTQESSYLTLNAIDGSVIDRDKGY